MPTSNGRSRRAKSICCAASCARCRRIRLHETDARAAHLRPFFGISNCANACNLEDSFPATGELRTVDAAAARLAAARQAADRADIGYFINARTDVFFKAAADTHDERLLDEVLTRARAYAAAGADGLFVPGLRSPALIRALTAASPLPVNIMRVSETPALAELAESGVARISHGPYPYLQAMKALAAVVKQRA
nr:isocitrate lyase/phosphoenolpyruvate mutase family protein [Burkholderia anthina]